MNALILTATARLLMPLLLLFSVFILLRGHNEPGGGFSGGLIAAAAYSLLAYASGVAEARAALRIDPRSLLGIGLLVALGSGLVGVLLGGAPLEGVWVTLPVAGSVYVGTPLVFDIGVYLVVIGTALTMVFELKGEEERESPWS
jgi:multicomponent Na+:H+ antiporter subunit B